MVSLGKKPKVCGFKLSEGNRQSSPVSSVEGVPAVVTLVAITGCND